jgi:hypothetical protein
MLSWLSSAWLMLGSKEIAMSEQMQIRIDSFLTVENFAAMEYLPTSKNKLESLIDHPITTCKSVF